MVRSDSARGVLEATEVVASIGFALGISAVLKLQCVSLNVFGATSSDILWRQLLARWAPFLQASHHERKHSLDGEGALHRCWPSVNSDLINSRSTSNCERLHSICGSQYFRALVLRGPAFYFHVCHDLSRQCICSPGILACSSSYQKLCRAPRHIFHSNVNASNGFLFWEVWLELARNDDSGALERISSSQKPWPKIWIGVMPYDAESYEDTTAAYTYFSGGTFLAKNVVVSSGGPGYGPGDALGMMLDCEKNQLSFWLNKRYLGTIFKNLSTPVTPVIEVEQAQGLSIRVGPRWRPTFVDVQSALRACTPEMTAIGRVPSNDQRRIELDWQGHEFAW